VITEDRTRYGRTIFRDHETLGRSGREKGCGMIAQHEQQDD
jgi:hypothetical protein